MSASHQAITQHGWSHASVYFFSKPYTDPKKFSSHLGWATQGHWEWECLPELDTKAVVCPNVKTIKKHPSVCLLARKGQELLGLECRSLIFCKSHSWNWIEFSRRGTGVSRQDWAKHLKYISLHSLLDLGRIQTPQRDTCYGGQSSSQ